MKLGVSCIVAFGAISGAALGGDRIEVGPGTTLAEAAARAKAGDQIVVPEGTFPGGIEIGPGVAIRGAGWRKTTIDASGVPVGLTVRGGDGGEVADLAIRGATRTDLLVEGGRDVAVRRARASGAINGVQLRGVERGRVENLVADGNRYGVIVGEGSGCVVANCTLVRNAGIGLSVSSGKGHVGFNNCLSEGSTGVLVGEAVEGLKLDHNLYFSLYTGKLGSQVGRASLGDWAYLSGLDARSVRMPVAFEPESFRPLGSLGWSLDRAPTTDWGTAGLGDVRAPDRDIDGRPRVGAPDVGAVEWSPEAPRPADGSVRVRSGAGLTSAGVFDASDREVDYLFQNLPLPAGDHPFWLPSRDFQGRPIPPGELRVKSLESDHRWEYLGWVGDSGEAFPPGRTAPVNPAQTAFDDDGRLLIGHGWSEDSTNVRCCDAKTGKILWTFGGTSMLYGLAARDGAATLLRETSDKRGELTRIDARSGALIPLPGNPTGRASLDKGDASGIAVLDGRLYLADRGANKLRYGPADGSRWDGAIDVASPTSPAADPLTKTVWVISAGRKVVAFKADGTFLAERDFHRHRPSALAAAGGRLAIATRLDGQVHILDLPDPRARAKAERTVGRGDGPFGPYLPDRFTFQAAEGTPDGTVELALSAGGELAVVDGNRVLVFDASGRPAWETFGVFGNATAPSFAEPGRVYDDGGKRTILLGSDADGPASWRPGSRFDLGIDAPHEFLGDFSEGGKTFGAAVIQPGPGRVGGELMIVAIEGDRSRPTLSISHDAQGDGNTLRVDSNGDGRIDARDAGTPLVGPDGAPLKGPLLARFNILQPNGDLLILNSDADHWATLWRRSRGPDGAPAYRGDGRVGLRRPREGVVSPYTFGPDRTTGLYGGSPDPGGGLTVNIGMTSSPDGTGVLNNAGTDLAGIDRRGDLRWFRKSDDDHGLEGLAAVGPIVLSGVGTTCEILAVDRDGLGLGSFGPPARVRYPGYFLDHPPAVQAFRGRDGKVHALIADNYSGRHHRYRLEDAGRIVAHSERFTLGAEAAARLASLPKPPGYVSTKPAPPVVKIPRLAAPLPIDGGLAKWRAAGITPRVVITPETAGGGIDGPRDCSAVVRLAYEGADLYAQFLVFDDRASFHQGVAKHHMQDGVEICINGFMTGFKFDLTTTTDGGPTVLRNRFFHSELNLELPPGHAPRSFAVLDDARAVEERGLIESVYGVDLSDCRVLVFEFKLPIDDVTYKGSPAELKALTPWSPGREFWVGFLVNDNDEPGTDVQNFLKWPATYDNFGPVELGARAVLE